MAKGGLAVSQAEALYQAAKSEYAHRISISQASKAYHVSTKTLRAAIERGELRFVRLPGCAQVALLPSDVDRWFEQYCTHMNVLVAA